MSGVPFGWGARTNSTEPAELSMSREDMKNGSGKEKKTQAVESVPFGWGARNNSIPPETDLHLSSASDRLASDRLSEKNGLSEKKGQSLPFGWESRTNSIPPESETSSETESRISPQALPTNLNAQTQATSNSSNSLWDSDNFKRTPALPFGWESRTNATPPDSDHHNDSSKSRQTLSVENGDGHSVAERSFRQEAPKRVCVSSTSIIDGLLVGTRLHFAEDSLERLDTLKLESFVSGICSWASDVVIAVGGSEATTNELRHWAKFLNNPIKIHVLPVNPWGKFTPALNAIVYFANSNGFSRVCMQSLEVTATPSLIHALCNHVDLKDTLVCGAAFPNEHKFSSGEQVCNGRTVPWNTLSVWNTRKIAMLGFPMIGDGLPRCLEPYCEEIAAGVEEIRVGILTSSTLHERNGMRKKCGASLPEPKHSWQHFASIQVLSHTFRYPVLDFGTTPSTKTKLKCYVIPSSLWN